MGNHDPYSDSIQISEYKEKDGTLQCDLLFDSKQKPLRLKYSARQKVIWQNSDTRNCVVRLDFGDEGRFEGGLDEFLEAFPPVIVCPNHGVVIGSIQWLPNIAAGPLPSTCVVVQDWTGIDIQNEASPPSAAGTSVQDFVQSVLVKRSSRAAIVIKDHGAGELTDFIVVDPEANPKVISFYHCKSSSTATPSDRVGDFYEVLEQSARSAQWCMSPRVMDEIVRHTGKPRSSPIPKELRWISRKSRTNFGATNGHTRSLPFSLAAMARSCRGEKSLWNRGCCLPVAVGFRGPF
jgi:hypothetical protein